jgi:hypothetical protein
VMATREGVGPIVARVETAVQAIYAVSVRLAPEMLSGLKAVFGGRSAPQLLDVIKDLDPADFGDGPERRQLESLQRLPRDLLEGDDLLPDGVRSQPSPPE